MQNNYSEEEIFELIDRASGGNKKAFELIVRIYQRYAFAIAFKIICDEDEAKEIVQETFIRIWKHINKYNAKIKFTTWMYKIVVNLCLDKLKSRKKERNRIMDITGNDLEDLLISSSNSENEMSNKELAMKIEKISNGLPEKQKIIFVLRDLEELSIKEVAEATGSSESSVKTNLFYARKAVKEKLIKWMN